MENLNDLGEKWLSIILEREMLSNKFNLKNDFSK